MVLQIDRYHLFSILLLQLSGITNTEKEVKTNHMYG
nr:MAG TPA: hypothetical protein [Caudoviricetes sp.]